MKDLFNDYDTYKRVYTEVFEKSRAGLNKELAKMDFRLDCTKCTQQATCIFLKENPTFFSNPLIKIPRDCALTEWKKSILSKLKDEISKDIYIKLQEINKYKEQFCCSKCATCCTLACSEFSYEELLKKAQNGDKFASDFTKVFIPYEKTEDAYKVYPQYFELVKEKCKDEKIYFYYCPKIDKKTHLCSDYENRPNVCRIFPQNPLSILPEKCGFKQWKEAVEIDAMMLYALIEIVEFYTDKIKEELSIR